VKDANTNKDAGEAVGGCDRPTSDRPAAVLFDVDGTLYHQPALRLIMAVRLAISLCVRPRRTWLDIHMIRQYRKAQEWLREECGYGLPESQAQLRRAAAMARRPLEEVAASVRRWMEDLPFPWFAICARRSLIRLIREWHALGVPLGVVSDYEARRKLEHFELAPLFRVVVCSTDPGVMAMKPNPSGLRVAAERLGVSPSRVVYVGDRPDVDGEAARAAGMSSVMVGAGRRKRAPDGCVTLSLGRLDSLLREEYVTSATCWVCGSSATVPFRASTIRHPVNAASVRITDRDYGQTAALLRCTSCGFVFARELPCADMVGLYRDMNDPEYQAGQKARRVQMRWILETACRCHPHTRTLLDVGAGTGLLVLEARAMGLEPTGVEPSHWCVETAADLNGVTLLEGTLEDRASALGEYDLVMLVDVAEHVSNPVGLFRQAVAHLAPEGRLVIVTPDIGSFLARAMGRRWWHHRIAHVCYFNRTSLSRALDLCGLEIECDVPAKWRFEAAYVAARLSRYVPWWAGGGLLRRMANVSWLKKRQLTLRLHDSRLVVARQVRRANDS